MHVLLIGQGPGRLPALALALRGGGHVVERHPALGDATPFLAEPSLDLVVLETAGPAARVAAAVSSLRRFNARVPLLLLAGSDDAAERIAALDAGADDCIAPAQSDAELQARLRVWYRRGLGRAENLIVVGPLEFDIRERAAFLERQPLGLTRRELGLLEALVRRAGRFVESRLLLEQLFEFDCDATLNTVQVYVCRLRRKIDHRALSIRSRRGFGYCLDVSALPAT